MKYPNIFLVVLLTILFSCRKKGCTDPAANNYNHKAQIENNTCYYGAPTIPTAEIPAPIIPIHEGECAILVNIKTIHASFGNTGTVITNSGMAFGTFQRNNNKNWLNAGTLKVESGNEKTLNLDNTNVYSYVPETSDNVGINFDSPIIWSATGSVNWPAFVFLTYDNFSFMNPISSGDVKIGASYTLSAPCISVMDTIYFGLYGPQGKKIVKQEFKGQSGHTFSASDIQGVGKGNGYVQIIGVNYKEIIWITNSITLSQKQFKTNW